MHEQSPAVDTLLALLQAGLWEKEPLLVDTPSPHTWQTVYQLARQHTVTGIAYRALCRLPDHQQPPDTLLMQWVVEVDAIERRNRHVDQVLAQLVARFHDRGINPVLLKGQGVARLYPEPHTRMSGDIDLYFANSAEASAAIALVREWGIPLQKEPDGSIYYTYHGVVIEHHDRLIDIYNPRRTDFLRRLEADYPAAVLPLADDCSVAIPHPFMNLLLLNTHIMKHALGRGVGLRQLCDMARACHAFSDQVDSQTMRAVCAQLGIARWTPLLHTFLVQYLSLPAADLPYPDTRSSARPLLRRVLAGGNFGQYNSRGELIILKKWRRKFNTASIFLQNLYFSCTFAPNETMWMIIHLLKGQTKCLRR